MIHPAITRLAAAFFLLTYLLSCDSRPLVVTVGCQDSPEQLLIGHMVALLIEGNPRVTVARRFKLGGPAERFSALKKGEIDVCAEYTNVILTDFLRLPSKRDRQSALDQARGLLDARYRVACLPPLGFTDGRVLLMRAADAKQNRIAAISDLRGYRLRLKSAFTPEFLGESGGYPALCAAYGFSFMPPPRKMSQQSLYWALSVKEVDVICGSNMDPAISTSGLAVLKDDIGLLPSGECCLLARREILEREPSLDFTLQKLSHLLDDETMRVLKIRTTRGGAEPEGIARAFLQSRGFLR